MKNYFNDTIFIRDFSYKRTKTSLLIRKVLYLMARHFNFLTCCSCRISSLRASTRFWSSRLSWDNKSVPSSAFNDSLVDSIACKLASKLCKLRCCGTNIRQNHSSKQSVDLCEFHLYINIFLWKISSYLFIFRIMILTRKECKFISNINKTININPVKAFNIPIPTLGINVFSDCCLFSFSIFISDKILSREALNFLCCVSICCIWFISWSISLLIHTVG